MHIFFNIIYVYIYSNFISIQTSLISAIYYLKSSHLYNQINHITDLFFFYDNQVTRVYLVDNFILVKYVYI